MYHLNDICCICFCNKNLQPLLSSSNDGITFYVKLTATIPHMCVPQINNTRLLCKECRDTTDTIYKFHKKCQRSSTIFQDYVLKLCSVSDIQGHLSVRLIDLKHDNNKNDIIPEQIYIKTEYANSEIDDKIDYLNSDNLNDYNIKNDNDDGPGIHNTSNKVMEIPKPCNEQDIDKHATTNCDNIVLKSVIIGGSTKNDNAVGTSYLIMKEEINIKTEHEYHGHNDDETDCKKNDLSEHIHTHTRERRYKCSICDKRFTDPSNCTRHMRIHSGKKPYECSVCNKKFTQSSQVNRHMRIHTEEKPYECSICKNRFSDPANLTKHIRCHTGEKPYGCNICNQQFIQSSQLTIHMRIHTGEKPNECTICNKRFSQITNLSKHMRFHTGEKPYACTICSKTFANSSNRSKHMRSHTGEKPYTCSICNNMFTDSSNLGRHMRIHTGKKDT